jgi:hypothetical protein
LVSPSVSQEHEGAIVAQGFALRLFLLYFNFCSDGSTGGRPAPQY